MASDTILYGGMMSATRTMAVVTGASSGIGREFADILAAHGHHIVIIARSHDTLADFAEELRERYGVVVEVLAIDLSKAEAPEEVFSELQQKNITVDILINNAGFGSYGMFADTDWHTDGAMIDLNVRTLTHLTRLFLPGMIIRRHGRIVNVASTAAFQPGPLMAVYYATKAYVLSFSEAIANELQGTGVTVTALCPGPTESGFQKAAHIEESPLVLGKRLPTSREVAEYGYESMIAGKTVAIHGFMSRLFALGIRLIPRSAATAIVRRVQEKRR